MDTINTINNDLETIKQDYLKLIEQINKSNNDPATNIKIDESVAVNATNMKAYRDSIGNYLKTFNDKRSADLQKSDTIKSQIDDATKKLETKTEKYNKLKNKNGVHGKSLTTSMTELDSLNYSFNLQFNLFVGLVILICVMYFIMSGQINGTAGIIILMVGIVLLLSYYCYKK